MDRIDFAWWNVGISPPIQRKTKDKSNERNIVREFVIDIFKQKSIDFFAFCEVGKADVPFLELLAQELHLEFLDLTGLDGRLVMDMSLMYETSKLKYVGHKNINELDETGANLRVGIKVIFEELKTHKIITFFMSHWNSKLSIEEVDRNDFSKVLRKLINNVFFKYGEESHVILLGDYNTQPYSQSLYENLKTTKDYLLIKNNPKKNKMLFNPFWKCISDNKFHSTGSYYLEHGKYDRWFAFDQMMFSSSFIVDNNEDFALRLDLDSFKYYSVFDCNTMTMNTKFMANFDHTPIFGGLYYNES